MNRPLTNPWFLIVGVAYLILLVLKKTGVYIAVLSDYGADLLALPVALSITLWVIRRSKAERKDFRYPWTYILVAVLVFAVLFEWIFPSMTDRFTADWIDIIAYGLGGVFFAWKLNG